MYEHHWPRLASKTTACFAQHGADDDLPNLTPVSFVRYATLRVIQISSGLPTFINQAWILYVQRVIYTRRFAPRAAYAARYARSGRKTISNYSKRTGP